MRKLALLALLAAAAHAGTYTCSLTIGGVSIAPTVTPNSCDATSPGGFGGFVATAIPGFLHTGGESNISALSATAMMLDQITIGGGTGTGTFIYHVTSNCGTAIGFCIGDDAGWKVVPFTYDAPIPISLSIINSDNLVHPPAMLGVTIRIDAATVLRPGISPFLAGSPEFFRGDYSVPGAFVAAGQWGYQFVAAPTPEPGTLALVGLALLAVLRHARISSRAR